MNFLEQTKLTQEEWKQLEEPIQNEKEFLILVMEEVIKEIFLMEKGMAKEF